MGILNGTRVKVISTKKKNHESTVGFFGTIQNTCGVSMYSYRSSTIGVLIDGMYNQSSNKGLFWYEKDELEILNPESEENNMVKLVGYKAVAVIKIGGSDYHYAIYEDGHEYTWGDKVLVSGACKEVVTIDYIITPEEAIEKINKPITAEVITYADKTNYEERVEKRKLAEELKKKMDTEMKKMDEAAKYEIYAKQNPELAKMLEEYKSLVG